MPPLRTSTCVKSGIEYGSSRAFVDRADTFLRNLCTARKQSTSGEKVDFYETAFKENLHPVQLWELLGRVLPFTSVLTYTEENYSSASVIV